MGSSFQDLDVRNPTMKMVQVLDTRFFARFLTFFQKKSSSKPINMRSSFEDLDARNPTVKAVRDLDPPFER